MLDHVLVSNHQRDTAKKAIERAGNPADKAGYFNGGIVILYDITE